MRFSQIEDFQIGELKLDEKNPRFGKAIDQRDCIQKIYRRNTSAFREMMESVASDDLSEVLLVHRDPDTAECTVHDGNRRAAAIKVLENPSLAPTEGLRKLAKSLRSEASPDFDKIQAQVSEDLPLIQKTVSERHGGGGAGRIRWNARASARYRFRTGQGSDSDWRAAALLEDIEAEDDEVAAILETSRFSFDAFRRVIRSMLNLGILDSDIFAEGSRRLDQRIKSETIYQTREAVRWAINQIYQKVLTLSGNRKIGQYYADGDELDSLLREVFGLGQQSTEESSTGNSSSYDEEDDRGTEKVSDDDVESGERSEEKGNKRTAPLPPRKPVRIINSDNVYQALYESGHLKLQRLYYSATTVSANMHPELVTIGVWAFYEVLVKSQPKTDPNLKDVGKELNKLADEYGRQPSVAVRAVHLHEALRYLRRGANLNKHDERGASIDTAQVVAHMKLLEGFTEWLAKRMEKS